MSVKEAKYLREQRKIDVDRAAPWRDVDARAVIPGTEKEIARVILHCEVARDRTVHITRPIEPARNRKDGHMGLDVPRDGIRAERRRTEVGVVGQSFLAELELRHEVSLTKVAEMLPDSLA